MYKLINILVLLFLFNSPAFSQSSIDFQTIDQETYALYLKKDWKVLIQKGRMALRQDIDYYYLRMRLGISYYETRKYLKASKHFKKALFYYENDPLALEYLYYSYLLSGKEDQARFFGKSFSNNLKSRIQYKARRIMEQIMFDYFHTKSFNEGIISNYLPDFNLSDPGYQIITRNFSNYNFSLSHILSPRIKLFHSYTLLDKNNYYFIYDGLTQVEEPGYNVRQNQYYLSASFFLSHDITIVPAFHYLNISHPLIQTSTQGQGSGNPPTSSNNIRINNYVGSLGIYKNFGLLDLGLITSISGLNDKNQYQGSLSAYYYPFGNLDLYTGITITGHYEKDGNQKENSYVSSLAFGWRAIHDLWIEIKGAHGDLQNYTESNGFLVFNSLDIIRQKIDLKIILPFARQKFTFFTGGRYTKHTSYYNPFSELSDTNINPLSYQSLAIYGGLKWKI